MTSPEIKELIQFLQNNGRSVISGQKKFSVTPQILRELNKILRTIKEDIYVSQLSTTKLINKYATSNDLMFLYDFVTKMPKLKISDTLSSHSFTIDVSDFTNLKYLELYKFNVKNTRGIQFLRENLEIVVCTRCLDKIGDLILNSDPDNNVSLIWSKLQHAVFSRNGLTTIDQSFIYTPWLQYLDISYNNLIDIRPVTCLSNLTHLNAAYNHLSSVPEMPISKLEVLLLNHNYISNISGLSKMVSLREVDLSDNSILEHVNLLPLADLSFLTSLNISRNPISYHPIHRSLTCGYLHENVANEYFLLDGTPLCPAEKEFIRYTSPSINNPEVCALRNTNSNILKKKHSKKTREAIIYEPNYDKDDDSVSSSQNTTPMKIQEPDDDEEYIKTKQQVEESRHQHGEEFWLLGNKFPGLLDIPSPTHSPKQTRFGSPRNSNIIAEHIFNSRSDPQTTIRIIDDTFSNGDSVSEPSNTEISSKENPNTTDISQDVILNEDQTENSLRLSTNASESESEIEEEEDEEEEQFADWNEKALWLVQRIDGDVNQDLFLVLNDEALREVDVARGKVITKWNLEWIERCLKLSSDPLTILLKFDVARRSDQSRKYIMEYADAQKLISRVQEESEKRPILSSNQQLYRCIKCSSLFCKEIQRRNKLDDGDPDVCPTCGSTHVLEEDESELWPNKTKIDGVDKKNKYNNITLSPSLSSIGSAASLDQSCDTTNGSDDHPSNFQDSDVEIISNPSQSSIEVLEVHNSRSVDSNVTVLHKFETPSNIVATAVNQLLTESSSSGSMTDSIITSYETNQHGSRGPQRISSSTVDEVLPEESSSETSPQQRRSEEKTTSDSDKSKNDKNKSNINTKSEMPFNYASVLGAFKVKIPLPSTPRKSVPDLNDLDTTVKYSYSDFTNIDHRIKLYIWDQLTPNSDEIHAFLRVDKLSKCGVSVQPFPALLVLTEKKLYFVKIIKEEKDDPNNWLQKHDTLSTDKIKLIEPILWKQGFSIEVEDRSISASPLKYICFLYDETRTDDFLSHIKDVGTVHVKTSKELNENSDLRTCLHQDKHVRNFNMTDLITICRNKDVKRFTLVGLIITDNDFIIVKGDSEWLLPQSSIIPTTIQTESITNLMKVINAPNNLVLQFFDENEKCEQSWEITLNTPESANKIIEAIREPWEELFSIELEVTYAAN